MAANYCVHVWVCFCMWNHAVLMSCWFSAALNHVHFRHTLAQFWWP